RPTTRWTVHGFRGGPKLAEQLLDAGMDISFGLHHNADSLRLTPEHRRHFETDDSGVSLTDVLRAAGF
ncbi:MAG: hydrolase TatD, partial [Bacteroidaceae bacterium]|nr:hydrolase TatD [Bacteroidaceae bacterium]